MKPQTVFLSAAVSGLLLAGCATAPTPAAAPAAPKAAPVAAVAAAKPVAAETAVPVAPAPETTAPAAPAAAPIPPPPLPPEAQAVVERLTQGGGDSLQHQLSDKTGFPEAIASLQPGAPAPSVTRPSGDMVPTHGLTADGNTVDLVDRDWTGLVLVPLDAQINKAHTSAVRLVAIEAHPLKDGCVRVWLRVRNVDKEELPAEVACTFRLRGAPEPGSPRFYRLQVPGGATRDVFFVSPPGDLTVYTPLVRTAVAAP